jgi:hypothetical protein
VGAVAFYLWRRRRRKPPSAGAASCDHVHSRRDDSEESPNKVKQVV